MCKVRVYRNLHKNCFSVQTKENGRWKVAFYATYLILEDAKFVVYASGRNRVLKEKRKNVHAYVVGNIYEGGGIVWKNGKQVSYDPYKSDQFYCLDSGLPVTEAKLVLFNGTKVSVQFT